MRGSLWVILPLQFRGDYVSELISLGGYFFTCRLVNPLHAQANFSTIIHFDYFYKDFVSFFNDIFCLFHTPRSEFTNMNKAILAAAEINKSTKINDTNNLTLVNLIDLWFIRNTTNSLFSSCNNLGIRT